MDSERRRQALTLFLYYLRQDIESEQKVVAGIKKLVDAYNSQPEYTDRETLEDTRLQSRQVCRGTQLRILHYAVWTVQYMDSWV